MNVATLRVTPVPSAEDGCRRESRRVCRVAPDRGAIVNSSQSFVHVSPGTMEVTYRLPPSLKASQATSCVPLARCTKDVGVSDPEEHGVGGRGTTRGKICWSVSIINCPPMMHSLQTVSTSPWRRCLLFDDQSTSYS